MVWRRPALIGSPGWVRSSAWIWLFFIERKHHSMGWRIDIEPDDVGELGGKAGVARALEGAEAMWLQLVRRQMRCNELSEMPVALAIARRGCQLFCVSKSRETLYVVEGITNYGTSDQGRGR